MVYCLCQDAGVCVCVCKCVWGVLSAWGHVGDPGGQGPSGQVVNVSSSGCSCAHRLLPPDRLGNFWNNRGGVKALPEGSCFLSEGRKTSPSKHRAGQLKGLLVTPRRGSRGLCWA